MDVHGGSLTGGSVVHRLLAGHAGAVIPGDLVLGAHLALGNAEDFVDAVLVEQPLAGRYLGRTGREIVEAGCPAAVAYKDLAVQHAYAAR